GGGIPLLMLLTKWAKLDAKTAFATCVAVVLPLCAVSAAVYFLRGGFPIVHALPYLAGGLAGGFIGGKVFRDVPNVWLRRIFALFLLYGAFRYLTQ
ncbi:MAG: sulfite exporter TauE/SafE family protein, partial [Oscillospiraceae bacterium]|nr:sulfite exporter TauE/SafE family protein [Oscillospiraceae bacterium]